ncbi:MAG: Cdc6/Cdc18 family protein [Nanoarchaeota archaeon]
MGLFNNILKNDETLFKDEIALDFSFQPKLIKHRENEQREIAFAIKPLFYKKNGKNLLIHGKPGVGKTVALKHVLKVIEEGEEELEDADYDDIFTIYINCWQKNTSYKIIVEICEKLNYKFIQNKKTEELAKKITSIINKKSVVFVFDEVDKLEDYDFLYTLLEQIYRKTIILITNYKDWIINLDQRIKSRLMPDIIEFLPYNNKQTKDILEQRKEWAFYPNVWTDDAFFKIIEKTTKEQDIRTGLHLMKESANYAEIKSSRTIEIEHVNKALGKIEEMNIKNPEELTDEEKFILEIIKKNSQKKIGELFNIYKDENGKNTYKTFQRKIKKLADNKFISVKKILGGNDGSTTIVNFQKTKKLNEF